MITTEDPRPLFVRFAPEKKALVRDAVADRMRALRRSVAVQKEEVRAVAGVDEPSFRRICRRGYVHHREHERRDEKVDGVAPRPVQER
jgi:hypothetical protein